MIGASHTKFSKWNSKCDVGAKHGVAKTSYGNKAWTRRKTPSTRKDKKGTRYEKKIKGKAWTWGCLFIQMKVQEEYSILTQFTDAPWGRVCMNSSVEWPCSSTVDPMVPSKKKRRGGEPRRVRTERKLEKLNKVRRRESRVRIRRKEEMAVERRQSEDNWVVLIKIKSKRRKVTFVNNMCF